MRLKTEFRFGVCDCVAIAINVTFKELLENKYQKFIVIITGSDRKPSSKLRQIASNHPSRSEFFIDGHVK
jgi:hypothetical protein